MASENLILQLGGAAQMLAQFTIGDQVGQHLLHDGVAVRGNQQLILAQCFDQVFLDDGEAMLLRQRQPRRRDGSMRHPTEVVGAFYEDILIGTPSLRAGELLTVAIAQ